MNSGENKFVPRVTQLDAVELDKEVIQVLKGQVVNITRDINVGFLATWEPEIDAALRFLIWKFSVNQVYSTFGQQLLSIKYGGEYNKTKAYLLAILTIGSKYINDRSREIGRVTGNHTLSNAVQGTIQWMRITMEIASIVNLLVFLMQGKYPRLVDRLLCLRPVSTTGRDRSLGYSFMTRELLWHGFIELLGVTLPLLNYHYLRRKAVGLFSWRKSPESRPVVFTVATRCAVCKECPVLPYQMGCEHVFCYYCIQANFLADPQFECPICGLSAASSSSIVPVISSAIH